MDVAAIIVNYRTARATIDAVRSLRQDLDKLTDPLIVVVDNDSQDGSLTELQAAFSGSEWSSLVSVIGSGHNGGFGSGVNFGIRHVLESRAAPRYFYVLNPDAVIDPGALNHLVAFMSEHPDAGLLGNLIRDHDSDIIKAFRFPSILSELESGASLGLLSRLLGRYTVPLTLHESAPVDWVSGVSMLFRSEVFSTAGFFDEDFFLYFEEIDLARRLHHAGWKVYFVAGAAVQHIGGLSTGIKRENRRTPGYWFDSRRRYYVKHHGRMYAAACDVAWLFGHAVFRAKNRLLRRSDTRHRKAGRDLLRYGALNFWKPVV
ncbi:MAG TPA: glycosyltransferase family 2 protein [Polyangia bacterium]|nr:glycosyltransferase family 2 protein [Polyangia bacterium]